MIRVEAYAGVLEALRQRTGVDTRPLSLLSFTIAGVQQFLDSARTTRDVWNGSYLVSYLMWKATERALEEVAGSLSRRPDETGRFVLIPAVEAQPFWRRWASGDPNGLDVAQFPNSVLLAVPSNQAEAAKLALGMEKAVEDNWKKICDAARWPLTGLLNGIRSGDLWDYQLGWRRRNGRAWQQVFEIYTAVWEVPDAAGFQEIAEELGLDEKRGAAGQLFELPMRLLTARKTLRDFEQFVHEGHRCSLCGQRTALANELTYEGVRTFWESVREIKALKYTFRVQDRLCAVCTVRRLAPVYYFQNEFPQIRDKIWFPSTSTIAAAAWVREVIKQANVDQDVDHAVSRFPGELRAWQAKLGIEDPPEALVPLFENLPGALRAFAHCGGRWFYPETYAPDQLKRDFGAEPREASSLPSPYLRVRRLIDKLGSIPDDYLAVLMADGDRMGEWMSGRQDPESFSLDWQHRLSAALADFADKARTRLERWIPAKVVYAGGDDVLAFVPRRCLLEALTILDLTFHQCVRRKLGYRSDSSNTLSLSVGCVVAKHKDPLKGAIVRAYDEMLKAAAKEALGRNAFAVYRTTEGVRIGAPFYAGGRRTLRPLRALLGAFRGKLSPRVRWELENLAGGLNEWPGADALETAQRMLIRRSFERHYQAPAGSKESEAVCRYAEELFELLCHWSRYKAGTEPVEPFRAFLDLLGLLVFLARHES